MLQGSDGIVFSTLPVSRAPVTVPSVYLNQQSNQRRKTVFSIVGYTSRSNDSVPVLVIPGVIDGGGFLDENSAALTTVECTIDDFGPAVVFRNSRFVA